MKFKKIMSIALAATMIASVAGCAKVKSITSDDFVATCEKQGAQEIDYDESDAPGEDEFEDGVYYVLDSDQIEDIMSDPYSSMYLSRVDIPYEVDDIDSMVVFAKIVGFEDIDDIEEPADLGEAEIDSVIGIQITLVEEDQVADLFDWVADALDDNLDYEVENFSGNEYYTGKNEGYLRANLSVEDLVAAFRESDVYGYLVDMGGDDMDDLEDALDNLSGNVSVAIYAKGQNIVIVCGFTLGGETTLIDSFCSDLGVQSPTKVPANADLAQAVIDAVDDSLGSLMSMYSSFATDY